MTCLGDELAALVDGELDHPSRERAQAHLLHCDGCRLEVDLQRRLKARLGALEGPPPPDALTARLLALRVPGTEPAGPSPSSAPSRPVSVRPAARPATRRPPARAARLRRRATLGGALLAAGLAGAFVLGAPRTAPSSVPVDPAGTVFVSDFTGGGARSGPTVTTVSDPAR